MGDAVTPLRAARLAAGLTVDQLARRARVSPSYLRGLEAGTGVPALPLAERLGEALGASVTVLFLLSDRAGKVHRQTRNRADHRAANPVRAVHIAAEL